MSLVGGVPNVAILALVLAIAPLGSAAFHPAGTCYVSRTLPRRRGMAVALFLIGGAVGSSLGPVIGAWLYGRHGVAASPLLLPLGLLAAAGIATLVPADRPLAGARSASHQPGGPVPPGMLLLVGTSVCVAWMDNSIGSYLPLYYTGRELSLGLASRALFAYSAAAAGGIFLGGTLSDRMPRWRILLVGQALTLPLYLGTVLAHRPWLVLAPGALGFATGLSQPTMVALAQEMMPQRTSLAAALTMGVSWVLGSLGAMATGFLADYLGMQQALLLNTGLPVIGAICVLAVRHFGRMVRTPMGANVVALPRRTLKGDV
jgi:FSR family fosmidomycin resistance protein-like MFS transporter